MDKYDYKIMMARVVEAVARHGCVPDDLMKELEEMYEADKGNIDSVFGVSTMPNYEDSPDTLYVFVSDRETWEDNHYCSDYYADDTSKIFTEMGLSESQEAVWMQWGQGNKLTKEELIRKISCLGFIYDEKFEIFMKDSMDE